MVIHIINNKSFSVYIPSNELNTLPDNIEGSTALSLLSNAVGSSLGPAKVELFSGNDGLLFFVKKASNIPELYCFSSLENLINAVSQCCDVPSSLYYKEDCYFLLIRQFDDGLQVLSEFGAKLDASPEYLLHLREHAKAIIPSGAISKLNGVFSKN